MSIVALVIAPILYERDANGNKVPKADWQDWWVSCIIIAVLLVLGWIYVKVMARYGTVHDREHIGREAERRKRESSVGGGGTGGGGDKHHEEDKEHAEFQQGSGRGGDISLDHVARGQPKRLPGDAGGGYGALTH